MTGSYCQRQGSSSQIRCGAATQFRNDHVTSDGRHCGEVNAKNGIGGYVGFKRFASGGANGMIYLEGKGMLGPESTEELMAVMNKRFAYLKMMNSMKGQMPNRPTVRRRSIRPGHGAECSRITGRPFARASSPRRFPSFANLVDCRGS